MVVLRWCQELGIEWHYIAPGKPTQNAFIESFNGPPARRISQRDAVHFARPGPIVLAAWKDDYNMVRHTVRSAI